MKLPYEIDPHYSKRVAYFSMEFGIDQALKTYAGGLGLLSGSHMRSAYLLKQNIVGVGILWSYGYYDQELQKEELSMEVVYRRKRYYFLDDTGITITLNIAKSQVKVKAFLLKPEIFNTAPIYFLTTDIEENDFLSRTITHKLYENNKDTRTAQEMVLGIGGTKILEALGKTVDIYHINENNALPLTFYLYSKYKNIDEVKKRVVFTTHTPENTGYDEDNLEPLQRMNYFCGLDDKTIRTITSCNDSKFNKNVVAFRMSKVANAVSKKHRETAVNLWSSFKNICPIISITNAQDSEYWADKVIMKSFLSNNNIMLIERKKELKKQLFKIVANQTGKLFDVDTLTIVWARRFVDYKRPMLFEREWERFKYLLQRESKPIQIVFAGKPHPNAGNNINIFNKLLNISKDFKNMAVLAGYELEMSMALKKGCDIWLNTPRIMHEASGTSGISAAMNAAVNFSTFDGWISEFATDGVNSFIIPPVNPNLPWDKQDELDCKNMINILENKIIPKYYNDQDGWLSIIKNSISDVMDYFDSRRMADEYYTKLYNFEYGEE